MIRKQTLEHRTLLRAMGLCVAGMFASCGGSTGNERDSGPDKTTLSVAATDPDGDALSYEWRVTAGTVDNRNARQTVWTLPPGRGLHFAYVLVTDGKGGYAQRQYAVGTDALDIAAPAPASVAYPLAAPSPAFDGTTRRLRLRQGGTLKFSDADTGLERLVYLPDAAVRLLSGATVVFSASADLAGEVSLPSLPPGSYTVQCAPVSGGPFDACPGPDAAFTIDPLNATARVVPVKLDPAAANNLRLHGHVALADDSACGTHDEYFGIQTSATVQVLDAAGAPLTPKRRVNRFGDYAIQAPTPVDQRLTLRVECGSARQDIDLRADTDAALRARLVGQLPIERSVRFTNRAPVIERVVANGPDGNVRGREVVLEENDAVSTGLPGHARFLSYKGTDSALSACNYYRSIGAVSGCDAQGRLLGAISLDDWKRRHRFAPYTAGNTEVEAKYINRRDLSLVRRMTATQTAPDSIAFVVCNNPGPEGRTQAEVDQVIDFGLADERKVACVAMEWSASPGVNGGAPFTKFLTFGPNGALIPSINLDGRGEKFMPGACIACHGGSRVGARFPETGNPSPMLGARFLPFDTGNYLFSTRSELTEASQGTAFRDLNRLVVLTEGPLPAGGTPTSNLVAGWYSRPDKPTELDKSYVPGAPGTGWRATEAKAQFYREVIGTSCRTCHTALGSAFNWDGAPGRFDGNDGVVARHFCGGTADLATNASMPNALASLNRLLDPQRPDLGTLKALMPSYLGCDGPKSDPVFPRK